MVIFATVGACGEKLWKVWITETCETLLLPVLRPKGNMRGKCGAQQGKTGVPIYILAEARCLLFLRFGPFGSCMLSVSVA